MIDLVIDPRDPELVPLGPSSDGSKYRPVQVTVATSRDVRLVAGGFVLGGAKVDEQIPVGGSLTVSVPATDGAEVLAADRSTFEYVVTLTWSRVGKSRDTVTRTFRGLLPTSLGATVQVTDLDGAQPIPAPYVSISQLLDTLGDEVATQVNTPGTGAYDAVQDVAAATANATVLTATQGLGVTYDDGGSVATTATLDANVASVHALTLTGATAVTITGGEDGQALAVMLEQDATGGRVATFPGVKWPTPAPTLPTTASASTLVTLVRVDGRWFASATGGEYLAPILLNDTFTDVNGTLLTAHTPNLGGPWVADSADVSLTNIAGAPVARVTSNAATAAAGLTAAAAVNTGVAAMSISATYNVSGGAGTNDRVNVALGTSRALGIQASIRANRAVAHVDNVEVYSNLATYSTGTMTLSYDGTQAWLVINGTEVWRSNRPGRTGTLAAIGFGTGAVRSLDNVQVMGL